MEKRRVGCSP